MKVIFNFGKQKNTDIFTAKAQSGRQHFNLKKEDTAKAQRHKVWGNVAADTGSGRQYFFQHTK